MAKIGTIAMSAWILALFFIGFDSYTLMTKDELGGINLIVHVSGAILGFTCAIALFRRH